MTQRLISSWQTVLLLELVQNGNEEAYGDQCEKWINAALLI
jgi:hypothetical protein